MGVYFNKGDLDWSIFLLPGGLWEYPVIPISIHAQIQRALHKQLQLVPVFRLFL